MKYTPDIGREFWYELDHETLYNSAFMRTTLRDADAGNVQNRYHEFRVLGQYPQAFIKYVTPRLAAWQTIAALQQKIFRNAFADDFAAAQLAFEDFGQGVLLDQHQERIDNNDAVHMMDTGGSPPVGYHRWHASIRAIQTFDNDPWWGKLDTLVTLAWAIQSRAQPTQGSKPNPPLSPADLTALRAAWVPLTPAHIDRQYELQSGVAGYHPDPFHPA